MHYICDLVLRLFMFGFSFWILMEFIFLTQFPTIAGLIIVAIIIITTVLTYALYKDKNIKACKDCGYRWFTSKI